MAKVTLRTGQLKRLGRLSAKNPARAEKVAGRMVERKSRVARGQEYLKKNVGEFMPDVPTVGKKGTKVTKAKKGTKVDTAVSYKKNPFAQMELQKKKKEAAFNKLRSLPKSKVGGKVSKMMGGGKCRGGCY